MRVLRTAALTVALAVSALAIFPPSPAPAAQADYVKIGTYSDMMMRAATLFSEGEHDRATFWFYAGQLRFRSYLVANPDIDPSGGPALFASLMETVGRPINEYAYGDIPRLVAILDEVLEWDEADPDPALPAETHRNIREGLEGLRDQTQRDAAQIRTQREANGLPNR